MRKLAEGIRADVLICDAIKIWPQTHVSDTILDVAKCTGRGPNLAHVRKFRDESWKIK